jgi:hypothetical protein
MLEEKLMLTYGIWCVAFRNALYTVLPIWCGFVATNFELSTNTFLIKL